MALSRKEKLERRRLWRIANKAKILAAAAEYRAKNREKVRLAHAKWYKLNGAAWARKNYQKDPERKLSASRKWKAKNPEYHRKYALEAYYADVEVGRAKLRQRRSANIEYHRQRVSAWFKRNRDKVRDIARRRRARKMAATVEQFEELEIFDRDGWRCYICDRPVSRDLPADHPMRAVLEHVVSLARGGAHSRGNTKCACFRCNAMKGANLAPEQVRQRLGLHGLRAEQTVGTVAGLLPTMGHGECHLQAEASLVPRL